MKKIKTLLLCSGAGAVIAAVLRVIHLLCLNEQGIVEPMWVSIPVYAVIAATFVFSLVAVRRSDFEEAELNVVSGPAVFTLPVFGILLLIEAAAASLSGFSDTTDTVAYLAAFIAGGCILICFALRCFGNRTAGWLVPFAYISLLVFLVMKTVNVFVGNGTSLAFTLNLFTLVMLCAELFFFKALAKEVEVCGDKASRASLIRSALMLVVFIPAELIGRVLCKISSDLNHTAAGPSAFELITDAAVFAVALCVLLAMCSKQMRKHGRPNTVTDDAEPAQEDTCE